MRHQEVALDSGRLDSLGREPTQLIILSERFRDSAWLLDFSKELWELGAHWSLAAEGHLLSISLFDVIESEVVEWEETLEMIWFYLQSFLSLL